MTTLSNAVWRLKNVVQTERTQVFTTRGGDGAITLILFAAFLLRIIEPLSLVLFSSFAFSLCVFVFVIVFFCVYLGSFTSSVSWYYREIV